MQNMYDILNKFNSVANRAVLNEGAAVKEARNPQALDYQEGPEDDEEYRRHHGLDDPDRKRERRLRATDHKTLDRLERQAVDRAKQIDEISSDIEEGNDPDSQKFGRAINQYFGEIYAYGDDGLDYLDRYAPFWLKLFLKHDGDIDTIIANEPATVLKKAALELRQIANDLPYELGEASVGEGNEFSGELAKAKASGAKQFKVDGKTYPVKESKPDFLDLDKDGNKKEPMKKAARDKKKKTVDESMQLLTVLGPQQHQARVYRDRQYNEYHVRFVSEGNEVAERQFTDSKQSAVAMAESWVNEALDINLLKALQKGGKTGIKDPESERNIHKKYGYRTDRDDDGGEDDDYDEWGNFKGKKKTHVEPGVKRGRGRPKGSGGGKRLGAKATGRSKLARGAAIREGDLDEDYDRDEYDEEGEMAKSFLRTIEDAAQELQDVLGDNENLPEWVQKKITLAYDYLDTARDYMEANPDEESDMDMDDEEMSLPEGSTGDYSAKKARAGKDIGKPGKQFAKIAKSAGERYGSKERGEKVAGAVLAKLRAKEDVNETDMDESALQAYLGKKKYGKAGMSALQKAGREGASKEKMDKIRARHDQLEEEDLDEKAVSKAQRRAAGIAHAAKKGDIPKSELRGASKEMAKMKGGELKKFAKTKEKGLPAKKEESVEETTTAGSVATAPSEGGKKSKGGIQFGKSIYENQLSESFQHQLDKVLSEGMSVNISIDQQGGKNLTINATDDDAERLAQLLQLAGMSQSDQSSPCESCGGIHEGSCDTQQVEEDLANAPDVTYADTDTMVNKLAGGLNGPKLQVNPNNMADNPLAMKDLGKGPYRQLNLGSMDESKNHEQNLIVDLYKRIS